MTDRTQAMTESLLSVEDQMMLDGVLIASLKARIAELEANEKAYEEIIGKKTYREVADRIRELEGTMRDIANTAEGFHCRKKARAVLNPKDTAP